MSAICKLQRQLRKSNSTQLPFEHKIPQQVHTPRPPHYGGYGRDGEGGSGRPKKRKKKKKNGTLHTVIEEVFSEEEDEKTKRRKKKEKKKRNIEKLFLDNEVSSSDSDDEPQPWDPPHIMDNLKDPKAVTDIPAVIASIKGEDEDKEIVWNHGETEKGRQSDDNLFAWIEAYSAHECRRKRGLDDLIFEDGGGGDEGGPPPPIPPPPKKRARKIK